MVAASVGQQSSLPWPQAPNAHSIAEFESAWCGISSASPATAALGRRLEGRGSNQIARGSRISKRSCPSCRSFKRGCASSTAQPIGVQSHRTDEFGVLAFGPLLTVAVSGRPAIVAAPGRRRRSVATSGGMPRFCLPPGCRGRRFGVRAQVPFAVYSTCAREHGVDGATRVGAIRRPASVDRRTYPRPPATLHDICTQRATKVSNGLKLRGALPRTGRPDATPEGARASGSQWPCRTPRAGQRAGASAHRATAGGGTRA